MTFIIINIREGGPELGGENSPPRPKEHGCRCSSGSADMYSILKSNFKSYLSMLQNQFSFFVCGINFIVMLDRSSGVGSGVVVVCVRRGEEND